MPKYKSPKATEPLPTIDSELPPCPYAVAVKLAESDQAIEKPITFDHPDLGRVAGIIVKMEPMGLDPVSRIPDFKVTIDGRRGMRVTVNLLESNGQIHHTFTEADEAVEKYRKARGIK